MTRKFPQFEEISNSEIDRLIAEHVHSERDRKILHRHFVDGICFEQLAEEFELSVRHAKQIVYKHGDKILKRI